MPTADVAPVPPFPDPDVEKSELRKLARRRRREAAAGLMGAAEALAQRFPLEFNATTIVAGYWPMGEEIDPRPLMHRFAAAGRRLALPAVAQRHHPLEFRAWRPDDPLEPGDHGTFHPPAGAAIVRPGLVLVPLLAFDRAGRRLGYGGGYYDRTLASLRESGHILAVGLAYSAQEFDRLPHGEHDQLLDGVATEAGYLPALGENA